MKSPHSATSLRWSAADGGVGRVEMVEQRFAHVRIVLQEFLEARFLAAHQVVDALRAFAGLHDEGLAGLHGFDQPPVRGLAAGASSPPSGSSRARGRPARRARRRGPASDSSSAPGCGASPPGGRRGPGRRRAGRDARGGRPGDSRPSAIAHKSRSGGRACTGRRRRRASRRSCTGRDRARGAPPRGSGRPGGRRRAG